MFPPGPSPDHLEPTVDRRCESRRRWRLYTLPEIARQHTARGNVVTRHENGDLTLHAKRAGVQHTLSPVTRHRELRASNSHHRAKRAGGTARQRASATRAANDELYRKRQQKKQTAAEAEAAAAVAAAAAAARNIPAAGEAADMAMGQAPPERSGIPVEGKGKRQAVAADAAASEVRKEGKKNSAVAASTHGLQVHEATPRKRKTSTQRELSWP